jgi:hypothetical protein
MELPEQFWNSGGAWCPEMGGSALLSPFLFSANGDLQNQPKMQHRQLILVVFLCCFFRSVLGFFSRICPIRVCCYGFHLLLLCFGRRCWLMVDLWPGMEIRGEAVVPGCCGEELLLLWCSLEAGVDGLPSLLLFVGLAARAGSAERGKNGGRPREPEEEGRCWEQGSERPRGGKVPAAVLAREKGAAERERGRGEVALWGEL